MSISVGDKFGLLNVISAGALRGRNRYWLCLCECGNQKEICYSSLSSGRTKSCGCLNSKLASDRKFLHGKSKTPIYSVWTNMKARCLNSENSSFKNYGGRGIKICDSWMNFENFLNDMGEPLEKLEIDRIDNDGDYRKDNCKWSTVKQQNENKRSNRRFMLNGESKTLSQLSEESGVNYFKLRARLLRLNWDLNKALTTP